MTESPDNLLKFIIEKYAEDECGIEMHKIGPRTANVYIPISLKGPNFVNIDTLDQNSEQIRSFVKANTSRQNDKVTILQFEVVDQAINMNYSLRTGPLSENWLLEVVNSLNENRADQSGDTIGALFPLKFDWAVIVTLSQDERHLQLEQFN